ncbi:MAG: hypothetical protein KA369_19255 [Spirochaetes bacterium]|nr:hypothetical protein [Spirochaetota bacterium]
MKKIGVIALILISVSLHGRALGQMKYTRLSYGETYEESSYGFINSAAGKNRGLAPAKILQSAEKLERGGNFKEAVNEYAAALPNNPSLSARFKSYMGLGRCFRELKEHDRSVKCFTNAEGLLSKNRGELYSSDDEVMGNLQDNLVAVYREISISYLRWNKFASAIAYLWQSRRIGGEPYSLRENTSPPPLADGAQKKLLDYPLYKFLARDAKAIETTPARTRYFRKMKEGDPDFKNFRAGDAMNGLFFVRPVPDVEIGKPAENGNIYQVEYDGRGNIIRIVYNDNRESAYASDFDRALYYRDGRPVSSMTESNTYNYGYCKVEYDGRGKIKYLCFITISTQVGHHGFMPRVELFVFE